jgi:hypothetical protein
MELPDGKSKLIQLCIAFTLVGLPILAVLAVVLVLQIKKIHCSWSCHSIFSTCIKRIRSQMSTTKNVEQSITMKNLDTVTHF